MFDRLSEKMTNRSAALLLTIDNRLELILKYWLVFAGLAAAARIMTAPHLIPAAQLSTFASYMLLVVAPFASTLLALRWLSNGHLQPQPNTRLARAGRWVSVSRSQAERHKLYGTGGLMVSLIVGIMLNVPIRAAEYLAAMPPIPAAAPHWLSVLHLAMTVDAVLFTSLYMIAFVAALRRVPLFPRLLLAIWIADLTMQLATAQMVASTHLPADVAAALQSLLAGNVKKVLISMALWLPYLLLSTRVNVTYRQRVPA
jgi:hypothetical protein